MVLLLYI